ncbi:MAG: N-methyl-L-tryptophan oxidase [Verrucomicrobiae bacterium]|nr:N-methyl-L-tryptophan oxidase [Verrucomicrobiae bacterium]
MPTWDVIVLGLGGMGSAAACHLARRGLRVLGLDAYDPPHDRGSSHGATRVIRQAYFEHPSYVPLLLRAYELWHELEQSTQSNLLCLPGGLMMGNPDSEVVAGSLRSARQFDLPHELLETADLRKRFPLFQVPEGTVALFEPSAGLVYCDRAVAAHLRAAIRHGAEIRVNSPVLTWETTAGGVEVRTSRDRFQAGQLVVTPGPWAPDILQRLRLPLRIERQVLFWFKPPGGIGPFLPEQFPVYVWEHDDGDLPYGFPSVDGPDGGVKFALYRSPCVEFCTPGTVDRRIRPDDEVPLRRLLRRFLPALDGPVVRAMTCMYTLTPDLHFVIDRPPGQPRVAVAAGFSGHGFKFCPVVGEILADLVTDQTPRFDLSLFGMSRFPRNPPGRD